ncbi:MAG TPA: hypothetical protein VG276_27020 [Actinomycetes bacterium]|jgi:hypothetical protein|nr:hypothetical protein [Actinomycetes bacterium]
MEHDRLTGWQRLCLLLPGLLQAAAGLWALLDPRSWYDQFPGDGRAWVSTLGPYDEHLVRDAGVGLLAVAVLLVWAAAVPERRLTQAAIGTWLVFQVPHFAYHLTTLDAFPLADDVATVATFALAITLPLAVLAGTRRSRTQAPAGEMPRP